MKFRYALVPPVAIAAIGFAVPTGSAGAALTTRCVGDASGVAIPGDLVVPAGESCLLSGVAIAGDVTVRKGADLTLLDGATVAGSITVAADGFAEVIGSAVDGGVQARNPFTVILDTTSIGGDVDVRADKADGGFDATLYATRAALGGGVTSQGSEVFLESTIVAGDVTTRNGVLTDLDDSTLYGTLSVRGNDEGSIVCRSEVDGDARFQGNAYGLQLGGPGPFGTCDGASYWGSSLTVNGNTGDVIGIDVSNSIVRGALAGAGNTPAPTVSANRVRGEVVGQFADAGPAVAARTARVAADQRTPDADGAIAARRAAAATQAAEAPTALL